MFGENTDRDRDFTPEKKLVVGMIPGYGSLFATYIQDRRDRELKRAAEFQDAAIQAAGLRPEDFLRQVADNERLSELFWFAMDAATRTTIEEKRRTLGRLFSSGIIDDAKIDEMEIFLRTLAALEAPELRVLRLATLFGEPPTPFVADRLSSMRTSGGLTSVLIQPMIDSLASKGLLKVANVESTAHEHKYYAPDTIFYEVSVFGKKLLSWIKEP